uniref:Conserved oligomeric Golgi complex subunit 4 n=1 Tax=Rhabditophanes sp. KR3021 TaxID=114890 RepID=A0AC35U2P8_9BILA
MNRSKFGDGKETLSTAEIIAKIEDVIKNNQSSSIRLNSSLVKYLMRQNIEAYISIIDCDFFDDYIKALGPWLEELRQRKDNDAGGTILSLTSEEAVKVNEFKNLLDRLEKHSLAKECIANEYPFTLKKGSHSLFEYAENVKNLTIALDEIEGALPSKLMHEGLERSLKTFYNGEGTIQVTKFMKYLTAAVEYHISCTNVDPHKNFGFHKSEVLFKCTQIMNAGILVEKVDNMFATVNSTFVNLIKGAMRYSFLDCYTVKKFEKQHAFTFAEGIPMRYKALFETYLRSNNESERVTIKINSLLKLLVKINRDFVDFFAVINSEEGEEGTNFCKFFGSNGISDSILEAIGKDLTSFIKIFLRDTEKITGILEMTKVVTTELVNSGLLNGEDVKKQYGDITTLLTTKVCGSIMATVDESCKTDLIKFCQIGVPEEMALLGSSEYREYTKKKIVRTDFKKIALEDLDLEVHPNMRMVNSIVSVAARVLVKFMIQLLEMKSDKTNLYNKDIVESSFLNIVSGFVLKVEEEYAEKLDESFEMALALFNSCHYIINRMVIYLNFSDNNELHVESLTITARLRKFAEHSLESHLMALKIKLVSLLSNGDAFHQDFACDTNDAFNIFYDEFKHISETINNSMAQHFKETILSDILDYVLDEMVVYFKSLESNQNEYFYYNVKKNIKDFMVEMDCLLSINDGSLKKYVPEHHAELERLSIDIGKEKENNAE